MTTLFGWGPMFGCPSPSPYVMKADVQLQMLGVDADYAIADLESVQKHKAPYVEVDGRVVEDSVFIRAYFEAKIDKDLDAGLDDTQRATAWALERMCEGHISDRLASERWLIDANFNKGPIGFFMGVPEAERAAACAEAREGIRAGMFGKGFGRHSDDEQMQLVKRDLTAISRQLADKPFLFGDHPAGADASVASMLISGETPFFEGRLGDAIRSFDNLPAFMARMKTKYLSHDRWPSMALA